MIQHIWIQDEIDWEEVGKFYNNVVVKWRGGKALHLKGEYQGYKVSVYFYNKEMSNKHLQYSLWCGMEIQKVICFEDIRYDSARYLLTRFRCQELPYLHNKCIPEGVSFVMEKCRKHGFVLQDCGVMFTYGDGEYEKLPDDLYLFL